MPPVVPIFTLTDRFDAVIQIGDAQLPVHIKRFSRTEMEAFQKQWNTLVLPPRGAVPLTDEQTAVRERAQLAFFDEAIRNAVTLDAGLILDRGQDVVDGAGVIEVFHSRVDVLSDLVATIYTSNKLSGVIVKNSNSPLASDTGSAASIPASGGDRQGPTAGSAGSSTSAEAGGATGAGTAGPSGETAGKVH